LTHIKTLSSGGPAAAIDVADHGCASCVVRENAVCAHCDTADFATLSAIKFTRSYAAGESVVWVGDRMAFVGSVISGVASLTQTLDDGRTQMVGLLLPSDFLGRPGRDCAPYTVTALTDTQLCCFHRRPFEELMRKNPRISARLLEMTLDELDAAREWLLLLGRKSAREKIASFLAIIARRAAPQRTASGAAVTFDLPLTRDAMADYLGLTIETVSRQISALKREGVIALKGARRVTVPDFARLVAESGDDADGGPLA